MNFKISVNKYDKIDFLQAVALFIFYCLILFLLGKYYNSFFTISILGYSLKESAIFIYLSLFAILFLRKQKIESIGLTSKNIWKSSLLGFVIGFGILLSAIISAVNNNLSFRGVNYLIYGLFFYTFEIALLEELVFRGFIQTRFVGFFKSKTLGIVTSGILFMLMHIPFQMVIRNMGLIEFISYDIVHLLLTFLYHLLFSFLFFKYNNIMAPTIVHIFLNLSFLLFI